MKIPVPCSSCYQINNVDLERAEQAKPICAKCKSYLSIHENVQDVNSISLNKLLKNTSIPVVVDFWASWCGPCKMFAPIFYSVAQQMRDSIIFVKYNTEADAVGANAYRIQAIPTLIVFKNGIEVDRQSGVMQKTAFAAYLSKFNK